MGAYQRQLPLADLLLVAVEELRSNTSISSYTFEGGVERRTYPDIFAAITTAINSAMKTLCDVIGLNIDSVWGMIQGMDDMINELLSGE